MGWYLQPAQDGAVFFEESASYTASQTASRRRPNPGGAAIPESRALAGAGETPVRHG
jgi:hypothetical protein